MKKRFVQAVVLAFVAALALTGCNNFKNNYYRPSAFGENSQCYYINDPAEAVMLQAQGFCDASWHPMMAPTYWQARYSPYYESAEYRDYYVPANRRAAYTTYFVDFDRTNASMIRTEQSKAQYKDNKGTVVDGTKVDRSKFGGGVRSKGGAGIRGDNGKSLKKNHDNIVKKAKSDQKKSSTTGGNSGGNKKSGNSGGIRSGGSGKSSSSGGSRSAGRR